MPVPTSGGYQNWNSFTFPDVVLYKGVQKLKVYFEKGGVNLGFFDFSPSKKLSDILLKPVSAETSVDGSLIYLTFNKMLLDSTVSVEGFGCTLNGNAVSITTFSISNKNDFQVILGLAQQITDGDTIKLNYADGHVKATDGTLLENFSNFPVKNNLPFNFPIPGKIEAEDFSFNQGLKLENTSDVGGGQDVGFTDVGDYLDYRIRVVKSAKYNMEVRVASLNSAGIIQVQQLNDQGIVQNFSTIYLPVTGGWQTWKSITAEITLTEGVSKLRVKILKTEFNMNWFKFTEKGVGYSEIRRNEINIYPNPVQNELTIESPATTDVHKTLFFRTLGGALVKNMELSGTEVSQKIYIGNLPKGFYILELHMSGTVFRTKLIVQ
jgi:hypothetical protein